MIIATCTMCRSVSNARSLIISRSCIRARMTRSRAGTFINCRSASAGTRSTRLGSSATAVAVRGVPLRAENSPNCSPGPNMATVRWRPLSSRFRETRPCRTKQACSPGTPCRSSVKAAGTSSTFATFSSHCLTGLDASAKAGRDCVSASKSSAVAARPSGCTSFALTSTERPASCAETRRTTCSARMMSAGPAVNADARKRGPMMAEFQNGRPPRPT